MVTRARILLADDHKEMRDMVIRLLAQEFEMLEPASDGRELLEKAAELKPDVCLLDISMPILSGIEVAGALAHTGSTAKIVFLTIHRDNDFVRAALSSGASGYVVKTHMLSDLCMALREVLAGRTFISPSVHYTP
jgi:DNA-binding NarL/FixJ family response regulator